MSRKKRGSSHIEMVVSFSFFMLFLLFLFIYIKPYKTAGFSDAVLSTLEENFVKGTKADYVSFLLKANNTGAGMITDFCIKMSGFPFKVSGSSRVLKSGVVVKSYTYNEQNLVINNISVVCINDTLSPGQSDSYYVYLSTEFGMGASVPNNRNITSYTVGGIEKKEFLSNKSLIIMKDYYNSQTIYPNLKTEVLKIPDNMDFAVRCEDCEGDDYTMKRGIPDLSDVYSKEGVYHVVYPNGEIKNKKFLFMVWQK